MFVAPGGVVPSGLVDDLPMGVIGDVVAGAPADAAFAVTGDAPGDLFGFALTVYDADGDGYDDVLTGSPGWDLGRGRALLLDGDALR